MGRHRRTIRVALTIAFAGAFLGAAAGCAAPGGILAGFWSGILGGSSSRSLEADVYAEQGRIAEAVREVEIALRRRPDDPELLTQAADLYLRADAPRRALAALEHATLVRSRDADVWERYAAVAEQCSDVESAYVGYRRALALDDGRTAALAGFARTARSLGILDEAKRAERRLRDLPPVASSPPPDAAAPDRP